MSSLPSDKPQVLSEGVTFHSLNSGLDKHSSKSNSSSKSETENDNGTRRSSDGSGHSGKFTPPPPEDGNAPLQTPLSQSQSTTFLHTESPMETSGGFSLVEDGGVGGVSYDGDFHAPPHTVIIPAATATSGPVPSPSSKDLRQRFIVSPAQVIPGSAPLRKHTSTSTVTRASTPVSQIHVPDHSPEVQFKLSGSSLHKDGYHEMEPLLDGHMMNNYHGQSGKLVLLWLMF